MDDTELVSYDDGDAVVLCDRSNPNAWLRADTVVELPTGGRRPVVRDRP